jgi:hypothetical protein
MDWKYYIMHEWPDGQRRLWGELFLLPDDPSYDGHAVWLTFECVGDTPRLNDEDGKQWHEEAVRKLAGCSHYVVHEDDDLGDSDLIVASADFTRDEFMNWVEVWIKAQGLSLDRLISAPLDDFTGRSDHADLLKELTMIYPVDDENESE